MANKFLKAVASILEVPKVSLDLEFRTVPGWCSLQGFGLLVLLENDFSAPTSLARFQELKTVRDLYREAFLAFAARVLKVDRAVLSGETAYQSIPEWDSVAHLKLTMEAEAAFGVSYALEQIPFLTTLEKFIKE